jgi:hypothetical protein
VIGYSKENTKMKIGKSNGVICAIYDRHHRTRDDGTVEDTGASAHLFIGPLSIDWWRGLRHRPTIRWDRRGNWKAA